MASETKTIGFLVVTAMSFWTFVDCSAQGFGRGPGPHGKGQGHQAENKDRPGEIERGKAFGKMGGGPPGDNDFQADRSVFQYLLANHEKIRRQITNLENGVETLTESDDPEIAAKIREHADAMHKRVKTDRGIHMRDPLFAEIFRNTDRIEMAVGKTAKGVKVIETSDDPYVAKLIQAHAQVVSKFVANGHEEVRRNHEIPAKDRDAAAGSRAKSGEKVAEPKPAACECQGKSPMADSGKKDCEHCVDANRAAEGPGQAKSSGKRDSAGISAPKDVHHGHESARKPDSR